ncbi:MAG TPA: hypothetical protein VI546_04880 [candidate division Zixibacteria bacterium]|nr:hypothetical protein [candidate division Zixibacteria bacterium]
MRSWFRALAVVAAGFFFVQCGKKGPTDSNGRLLYGRTVVLQPVNLPEPPAGMVYQAWVFQLEKSGASYSAKYHPYRKMGWVGYPYHFTDPDTGGDIGYNFFASPDTANLFTPNLTVYVRADTIRQIVEKLLRGQSVTLSGQSQSLAGMIGFLFSLEPALETGPDTATPAHPFLAAYSNDTGKFEMIYPYDYRHPDFTVQYFMATPTDTLFYLKCACNVTDSNQIKNEGRGLWFGFLDTTKFDRSRLEIALPDTVLRKLCRDLLPGWQFEGWLERGGTRVSLGHFTRGDTADSFNPYANIPDSAFLVPGEDFLVNPPAEFAPPLKAHLLGSILKITLEPRPDTDPAQFPVVLFQDTIPSTYTTPTLDQGPRGNLHLNFRSLNRARFFPKINVQIIPESR